MRSTHEIAPLVQYLLDTQLMIEEGLLLYTVYVRTEAPDNKELLTLLTSYYERFPFYDQENEPIGIPWTKIIQKLVGEGYLITYPGYLQKDKKGIVKLDTSRLEVTEKFKQSIIYSDREKLWEYYVAEVYGPDLWVNGGRTPTILPDRGETLEDLKTRFWKLCGNGLKVKIAEFFENTKQLQESQGPTMKITTFLKSYDGLVMTLRIRREQQLTSGFNSY